MTESNYDILRISEGASKREIREAYRNLVLEIHSDRVAMMNNSRKLNRHMKT